MLGLKQKFFWTRSTLVGFEEIFDLYQMHSQDLSTPPEETLRALDDLVRQGKVRYVGSSNFSGWVQMRALATADRQIGRAHV